MTKVRIEIDLDIAEAFASGLGPARYHAERAVTALVREKVRDIRNEADPTLPKAVVDLYERDRRMFGTDVCRLLDGAELAEGVAVAVYDHEGSNIRSIRCATGYPKNDLASSTISTIVRTEHRDRDADK